MWSIEFIYQQNETRGGANVHGDAFIPCEVCRGGDVCLVLLFHRSDEGGGCELVPQHGGEVRRDGILFGMDAVRTNGKGDVFLLDRMRALEAYGVPSYVHLRDVCGDVFEGHIEHEEDNPECENEQVVEIDWQNNSLCGIE